MPLPDFDDIYDIRQALGKINNRFLKWESNPKRMGMTNGGGNIVRSAETVLSLYLFGGTNVSG